MAQTQKKLGGFLSKWGTIFRKHHTQVVIPRTTASAYDLWPSDSIPIGDGTGPALRKNRGRSAPRR
jgi:hypothetical protein